MNRIAIIPARGGSKRIPRKNILPFCGKPIIAYSIQAAQVCGLFERVLVSTDDQEIAEVARSFGAETPFMRPAEIANDMAGTDVVLLHALRWLEQHGQLPDYACCIYATAPFISPDDLTRGFEILTCEDATTAFSVTTFPYTIFRSLKINKRGRTEMFWPENYLTRSQDLPEAFHDAGQFYWLNVIKFIKDPRLFSGDSVPVILPRKRVQDIDTQEDWAAAEALYLSGKTQLNVDHDL